MPPRKPKHLSWEYGSQFSDPAVAEAYRHRPPYPDEVYSVLTRLLVDRPYSVLDLGCGLGELSRKLAAAVERVDAVDPSRPMLRLAKSLPTGSHPNLRWFCCKAEDFEYHGPYSLVVTAESLHWMDWHVVLPAIGRSLSAHGCVVILNRRIDTVPWWDEVKPLIPIYTTNQDYRPYSLVDELRERNLFHIQESLVTKPASFTQTVDDYIESWHSRNGLSRNRMKAESALEFDGKIRELLASHERSGVVTYHVEVEIAWGVPRQT